MLPQPLQSTRSTFEETAFHYILLAFLVLRLIALLYFIDVAMTYIGVGKKGLIESSINQRLSRRQSKWLKKENTLDTSTLLMFVFLVGEYIGFAAYRTIQEIEGLAGIDSEGMTSMHIAKQLFRNTGYICANSAFIVNINRWLHIINFNRTDNEKDTLRSQLVMRKIRLLTILSITLNLIMCGVNTFYQIQLFAPLTEIIFLVCQSLLFNPALALGYFYISRKLKEQHVHFIANFSQKLSEQEIDLINKTDQETQRYFCYIQQYLITFTINLLAYIPINIALNKGQKASANFYRFQDLMNVVFSISKILMLYGISILVRSAKTTVNRQKSIFVGEGLLKIEDEEETIDNDENPMLMGSFGDCIMQITEENRDTFRETAYSGARMTQESLKSSGFAYDLRYMKTYSSEGNNKATI
ncbi:hypothetical protein FGO68_gene13424 [Halteria grandinella]|uniref:Uncharacterized protein n=1 Tax=Halteria grandinella TaxID=5974 RepID=A0A8J8NMR9_HALGN|nr:hypothetical protein FGO68_gene13424 [Halteria grandinella]